MESFLAFVKRLLPEPVLRKIRPYGHGFLAYLAAVRYGFPSNQMVVIGVTGTAGKSTTIRMLADILNGGGKKCGYVTTIDSFDGETAEFNSGSMSMPGRFRLQRILSRMLGNECSYAIIECTSEGLAQNRHLGISFDIALLTILDKAHIDAHQGFENYRKAKAKLFDSLRKSAKKFIFKEKAIGVNLDSAHADHFLAFSADLKFGVTFEDSFLKDAPSNLVRKIYKGTDLRSGGEYTEFRINGGRSSQNSDVKVRVPVAGKFNAYNALLACACANVLGVPLEECALRLAEFRLPGRMEKITNDRNLAVYLDYAPEPVAMKNALESLQSLAHKKIIHVFGSTGGHRDISKRFEFGEISARLSDIIIITNDDVYESDPVEIAQNIKQGIERVQQRDRKVSQVLTILDRRSAIKKAVELAQSGDILIVTGKGSEQFISLSGNKTVPWDDKKVLMEFLGRTSGKP